MRNKTHYDMSYEDGHWSFTVDGTLVGVTDQAMTADQAYQWAHTLLPGWEVAHSYQLAVYPDPHPEPNSYRYLDESAPDADTAVLDSADTQPLDLAALHTDTYRLADHGPGSRAFALLIGVALVVVVMLVLTGISPLRGW